MAWPAELPAGDQLALLPPAQHLTYHQHRIHRPGRPIACLSRRALAQRCEQLIEGILKLREKILKQGLKLRDDEGNDL